MAKQIPPIPRGIGLALARSPGVTLRVTATGAGTMPAPLRLPQHPPQLLPTSRFKRLLQQLNDCHEEERELRELNFVWFC